ncbi:hypothetical protein [Sphingobacterium kyonggiense]
MAVQGNLVDDVINIDTSKDSIVIIHNIFSIPGGKTLDVTGFTPDVINAGHILIKNAAGDYKPMPLNAGGTAYAALPADHTYAGVLVATILKKRPYAGVMINGYVNEVASPFPVTDIKAAFLTAVNKVEFRSDLA